MWISLVLSSSAGDGAGAPIGVRVDNFSLPDYRGKTHTLADYQDKLVVLAFIGIECPLANSYAKAA